MQSLSGAPAAPPAAPDPTQGSTAPDDSSQGIVVYMAVQQDGSIQVGMQGAPDDSNAPPSPDGSDSGDQTQTFTDPDEALQAAGQLLQQAMGGADDSGPQGDGNAELAPADAKAAWSQMAAQKDKKRAMAP